MSYRDPDEVPLRTIVARRVLRWVRREVETPLFGRLLLYQACSVAGDALVALALAGSLLFSVPDTSTRNQVLLYLALTLAPLAVVAPVLAGLLDRHGAGLRITLIASGAGRAFIAWLVVPRLDSVFLFPLAFGVLALSRAALVARGAMLPSAAPADRTLVSANSSIAKTSALAGIVVLPIGIGIGRVFGATANLRLASLIYLVAALPALRLPSRREVPDVAVRMEARRVRRPLGVRQSVVATAALRFLMGFLAFHLAFGLAREQLTDIGLGVLIGAAALGSLIGGVLSGRARGGIREEGIVLSALAVAGVAGIAGGMWFSIPLATALVLGFGVASGASKVAFDSLVQRATEEVARGWLFARYEAILQLSWVMGALIPVAVAFPLEAGIMAAGGLSVLLTAVLAVSRRRGATPAAVQGR